MDENNTVTTEEKTNDTVEVDNDQQKQTSTKTFTQEELDNIVKRRVAAEKRSWEKAQLEAKTEAEKLENMSEKEKKEYQANKREQELADREKAITKRELTAVAKEQLADKGMPTGLSDFLDYTDADSVKKSVETISSAFQSVVEKAVDERLKGGKTLDKAKTISEEDQLRETIRKNMKGW